jgi:hypothetical protein
MVPVRRGFEWLVQFYLESGGDIWGGGDLPKLASAGYLSIAQEIQAIDGATGDEFPQGPKWKVRVPTQLVALRSDSALPVWQRDPITGDYVLTNPPPDVLPDAAPPAKTTRGKGKTSKKNG